MWEVCTVSQVPALSLAQLQPLHPLWEEISKGKIDLSHLLALTLSLPNKYILKTKCYLFFFPNLWNDMSRKCHVNRIHPAVSTLSSTFDILLLLKQYTLSWTRTMGIFSDSFFELLEHEQTRIQNDVLANAPCTQQAACFLRGDDVFSPAVTDLQECSTKHSCRMHIIKKLVLKAFVTNNHYVLSLIFSTTFSIFQHHSLCLPGKQSRIKHYFSFSSQSRCGHLISV